MQKVDLVELGNCRKPHGVKGALALNLHNTKESILKKGAKIWVSPLSSDSSINPNGQEATIESISFGNKTICTLKEVSDRNMAEAWIPFAISVSRQEFPEPKEGELYLNDLIGCDVLNESGSKLGEVTAIGSNGVQDILHVSGGKEDFDVLLIETFIVEIDLEKKKVVIVEPEIL